MIYVMTHKPCNLATTDSHYIRLHVGSALHSPLPYLRDDEGDSISEKNENYCELTGMYYIWKNRSDDCVGICHYRRYLIDGQNQILNWQEIQHSLQQVDMIVSNKQYCQPEADSVLEFYAKYHYAEDLIATGEVIREMYPSYWQAFEEAMVGDYFYGGNLLICRKPLYDQYMEWLFSVLFTVEQRIDISHYNDYQKRVFGFLAERLLLVYIKANRLVVRECEVGEIVMSPVETPEASGADMPIAEEVSYTGIQRLLVYKGISQYNALRFFADEMVREWRNMGIKVDVVGVDLQNVEQELDAVMGQSYDAIFAMNGVLSDLAMADGTLVQNTFQAPYYAYYVDHPYFNHGRVLQPIKEYYAICVEETFANYMRDYYPNLKSVYVMPQAGMEGSMSRKPFKERSIPLVFLGTYRGYEGVRSEIAKEKGALRGIMECMIKLGTENPSLTLEQLFSLTLGQFGISLSKTEFANILSQCKPVDTYLRAYYRENAVKVIVEAGISIEVYGNGWEQMECGNRELLHCHPPIDYREFLDVLADAKFVLNVLPWAKAGFHDRIACTMLNGAVSISDESTYLKKELQDGREIVLYSLNELSCLPERIRYYMEQEEEAECIAAAGYAYAKQKHTWKHRAKQVLKWMEQNQKRENEAVANSAIKKWLEWKQEYEKRGYQFYLPEQDWENTGSGKKQLLLITHQLSRSGAPLALYSMAQQLRRDYHIAVMTVELGELLEDYRKLGIPVIYVGKYWNRKFVFKAFAKQFDGVIANTILNFPAVVLLDGIKIPVFWWIHEHENYFDYGRGEIPDPHGFHENVHVLAAGKYVQRVIQKEFSYLSEVLDVGISEVELPITPSLEPVEREIPLHFLIVGTYGWEKGQDIVVNAYRGLSKEEQSQIALTFIGSEDEKDDNIYKMVQELAREVRQVNMFPLMPRDVILQKYAQADGVIIASRQETLSMVAVENMMLSKCVISSTGAGISYYIEDMVNGYCFPSEDVDALTAIFRKGLSSVTAVREMGKKSRQVYDDHFSMSVFVKQLENKVKKYL